MVRSVTRNPTRAVAYCATCKQEYGDAAEHHLGTFFLCAADDPSRPGHLARVVKGAAGETWLRAERRILCWEKVVSPMRWFGCWGGLFHGRAGAYVAARLGIVLAVTAVLPWLSPARHLIVSCLAWAVCIFLIADILLSHTSIAFISRFPAHPIRSVVFALVSLFTVAVSFAALYLTRSTDFSVPLTLVRAIYFSVVTMTTLGFGDIYPLCDATLVQLLVIAELLVGIYFVVVLLAVVASWANQRPADPPVVPLSAVLLTPSTGAAAQHAAEADGRGAE